MGNDNFSVHTFDASKESGEEALGISVVAKDAQAFLESLRVVKLSIVEWAEKCRTKCAHIQLTVTSNIDYLQEIQDVVGKVYERESTLAPILQSLHFKASFLNEKSEVINEISNQT